MTIADVLAIVFGLVLVCGGLASLAVLLGALFPETINRAGHHAGSHPIRMGFLGGFAFFGILFVAVIFSKLPGLGHLLALITLVTGLTVAMIGGAGVIRRLATKLSPTPQNISFQELVKTAAVLELTMLIPFVGWLVVLPVTFAVMLGTGLRALLHIPRAVAQPAGPRPVEPMMYVQPSA